MDPHRVVEKVTTEIIDHFRLPKTVCFPFIKKMLSWVYVAGWEEGMKQKGTRNPVMQTDEYGNIIKIHPSLSIAARRTHTTKSNISKVLNGKSHSAGGFLWRKVNDPKQIHKILEGWQDTFPKRTS